MLQCKHKNERLEFGMETVSTVSHTFINSGGLMIPCRTAIVDLGLSDVDPGLTPDGAYCGENKVCIIIILTTKVFQSIELFYFFFILRCV